MHQRSGTSKAPPGPNEQHVAGVHADIYFHFVPGYGRPADVARCRQSVAEIGPDVVMVALCPSRMAMVSRRHASSTLTGLLARSLWARLSERSSRPGNIVGGYESRRRRLFCEHAAAVMEAAERDVRVVFGDRDIYKSVRRGWLALGLPVRAAGSGNGARLLSPPPLSLDLPTRARPRPPAPAPGVRSPLIPHTRPGTRPGGIRAFGLHGDATVGLPSLPRRAGRGRE